MGGSSLHEIIVSNLLETQSETFLRFEVPVTLLRMILFLDYPICSTYIWLGSECTEWLTFSCAEFSLKPNQS